MTELGVLISMVMVTVILILQVLMALYGQQLMVQMYSSEILNNGLIRMVMDLEITPLLQI